MPRVDSTDVNVKVAVVKKFDWRNYVSRKFLQTLAIEVVALVKGFTTDDPAMASICFGTALITAGIYGWSNVKAKDGIKSEILDKLP